ncbi:Transducin/WD40 repeat-like superfamily protein [Perilla frutescens var. frutescens]|nr:Transducin/WD40 repeat-like superfamily protein [Perilla frutescens var. frutescens]
MLCGHATPISDLGICFPLEPSEDRKLTSSSDVLSHPNSVKCGALISASSDGVLCVWSRASGHCRRRRKLPPWTGSPFMIRPMPNNNRYVCITCTFVNLEHQSTNSVEGHELVDTELQNPNPSKCTIIIVDSFTLAVVQTVFHGNVSIGPLKSTSVVFTSEDMESQSVMIIDVFSKVLFLPIVKDSDLKGQNVSDVSNDSSNLKVMDWADESKEKESLMAFAKRAYVLALVHRTYCTFRQAHNGIVFGKISFTDDQLCYEDKLYVVGGIFLKDDSSISSNGFVEEFVVWNNAGVAIIYRISYSNGIFKYDPLSVIPAVLHPSDMRLCFSFIPLRGELVSSSMVISENYPAPYAIVYGFFSGDIEIVRFHMFFSALESLTQNQSQEADSNKQKHHLSGHKGAVLCLASHLMVSKSGTCSSNHVLLSGSMDCTVRVWDLESGNPITVLHQHVAPVRQIIRPPTQIGYPWSDCFLTVGDDLCVALVSLHTLRVERLFPGHVYFPARVLWDGVRGYIACLCPNHSEKADLHDILYIWDVKTGARERVLRGAAAHSMFDHFLKSINEIALSSNLMNGNTSASSLVLPMIEPTKFSHYHPKFHRMGIPPQASTTSKIEPNTPESSKVMNGSGTKSGRLTSGVFHSEKHPIKSYSPFPGVSTLCFDLFSLMSLCSMNEFLEDGSHLGEKKDVKGNENRSSRAGAHRREDTSLKEVGAQMPRPHFGNGKNRSDGASVVTPEHHELVQMLEGCLLQFSLSFLHLWDVDKELDNLLITEMHLKKPDSFIVSSGILGDRGSMTLTFPGSSSTLELWRSSSEYSALRSLTMVSLAQHLISLSHSCSSASGALAAFYTRKFAEKVLDIKPPRLQVLASFWQSEFEHVKMAARSLFHCAASRSIPHPLCCSKATQLVSLDVFPYKKSEKEHGNATAVCSTSDVKMESKGDFVEEESEITSWLESYELQDWISCVGGTTQDAMTSQIIVAAALAVWYPSLVKPRLATVVVHPLLKLVMAMNEKYSAAAAEILAEGMESTWKMCIGSEIPRLIGDIFFQVECVSGTSTSASSPHYAAPHNIRDTLVGILLPSLAMADIPGFLHVIESQIWSTASDSPVHVVSLMTLIRVTRGSSRNLAPYLDQVVMFILQTMDPSNSTMRRSCLQSSMTTLKEVVRVFPMVALNDTSTRLAVGDAIGEMKNASIRVYDMQSMSKIKVLDASGQFVRSNSETKLTTAISSLSFSPDGEGLVAFSENGLMIRWWSLGSVWWEKLSRNLVPVQCSKLIFAPEWEGLSPNSTRSSTMGSVLRDDEQTNSPGNNKAMDEMSRLKHLVQNLDLSYRLEWVGERTVKLSQHSNDIGTFQL